MAPPSPATSSADTEGPAHEVHVDIDGDGRSDRVTLSTARNGRRTKVAMELAAGGTAKARVAFRAGDASLGAGERLLGVAALTAEDQGDLIILARPGTCNSYWILRWKSGRLTRVPNPLGGRKWRVCGLGPAPQGIGYRSLTAKNRTTMVVYLGRVRDQSVRMRRVAFAWRDQEWDKKRTRRMRLRAAEALPLWGLDFSWRTG